MFGGENLHSQGGALRGGKDDVITDVVPAEECVKRRRIYQGLHLLVIYCRENEVSGDVSGERERPDGRKLKDESDQIRMNQDKLG